MTEAALAALEQQLTAGEPYTSLSEREYIALARQALGEVQRLRTGLTELRERRVQEGHYTEPSGLTACPASYGGVCECGFASDLASIDALLAGEADGP